MRGDLRRCLGLVAVIAVAFALYQYMPFGDTERRDSGRTTASRSPYTLALPDTPSQRSGTDAEAHAGLPVGTGTANIPMDRPDVPSVNKAVAAKFAAESSRIDALVTGSAGVSAPQSVVIGEPFILLLRVSPGKLSTVLESLEEDLPENKTRLGRSGVKLTPRMSATVSGLGFEIFPKEGVVQAVVATEPTTWQWEARAVDSGFLTLTFTLSGTVTVEGKEVPRNFYQYRQKVNVVVSPWRFFAENWQWFVTSLLLPAAGAVWALFRRPTDAGGVRRQSHAAKLRARLQDLRCRRRHG